MHKRLPGKLINPASSDPLVSLGMLAGRKSNCLALCFSPVPPGCSARPTSWQMLAGQIKQQFDMPGERHSSRSEPQIANTALYLRLSLTRFLMLSGTLQSWASPIAARQDNHIDQLIRSALSKASPPLSMTSREQLAKHAAYALRWAITSIAWDALVRLL